MIRSLSTFGHVVCDLEGEAMRVERWSIANLSDVSGLGTTTSGPDEDGIFCFIVGGSFANDEDAVLFKMRWEGVNG